LQDSKNRITGLTHHTAIALACVSSAATPAAHPSNRLAAMALPQKKRDGKRRERCLLSAARRALQAACQIIPTDPDKS
jgi:hypothetical protein